MKTVASYLQKGDNFDFFINGCKYVVTPSHINYKPILNAMVSEDWSEEIAELVDLKKTVKNQSGGDIDIKNGGVFYKNRLLPNSLASRWIKMYKGKLPLTTLANYIHNLYENPAKSAIEELDMFMEACELPLTPDGCFLAYRIVQKDHKGNLWDRHSRKVNNNIGATPSMPRNEVCDDRNVSCSTGYHFCSLNYLKEIGWNARETTPIMIMKINPRDVVSIPKDYNNQKGRCCAYEIVAKHIGDNETEAFHKDEVVIDPKELSTVEFSDIIGDNVKDVTVSALLDTLTNELVSKMEKTFIDSSFNTRKEARDFIRENNLNETFMVEDEEGFGNTGNRWGLKYKK